MRVNECECVNERCPQGVSRGRWGRASGLSLKVVASRGLDFSEGSPASRLERAAEEPVSSPHPVVVRATPRSPSWGRELS